MADWQPGHWPQVGVGVFVIQDGKLLFGKRVSDHGHGVWCPPGGKLDPGETVEDCAAREAKEETGLAVQNIQKANVYTNDFYPDEKRHYVTVYALGEAAGEPKTIEPDKIIDWQWVNWDDLPQPLFKAIVHLQEQGYRPPGT